MKSLESFMLFSRATSSCIIVLLNWLSDEKEKEKERKKRVGEANRNQKEKKKKNHGGVSSDSVYFKSLDFPWNLSV